MPYVIKKKVRVKYNQNFRNCFLSIVLIGNLKHHFVTMRTGYDIAWIHGSYGHVAALAVPGSRYHARYEFQYDMNYELV